MAIEVRPYRNTDVSAVCAVWRDHHASFPEHQFLDEVRFELTCLSKPFFNAQWFFCGVVDGRVEGFLCLNPTSNLDMTESSDAVLAINALCVRPGPAELSVAVALLDVASSVAQEAGGQLQFKPMLPHASAFLGLGPADSMAGAVMGDARLCGWLDAAGFVASGLTCLWELSLPHFQAPVNREQIQIRRATQVNRIVDEPMMPWWQACVLGHTEPSLFTLFHRTEKRQIAESLVWTVAPEIQGSPESVVWLWPPAQPNPDEQAYHVFLLAEMLRQFQQERVDSARVVSTADDQWSSDVYQSLGFSPIQQGLVYSVPAE